MLVSHDSEVDDIAMLVTIFGRKKNIGNIILHDGDTPIGWCLAVVRLTVSNLVSNTFGLQHPSPTSKTPELLW